MNPSSDIDMYSTEDMVGTTPQLARSPRTWRSFRGEAVGIAGPAIRAAGEPASALLWPFAR